MQSQTNPASSASIRNFAQRRPASPDSAHGHTRGLSRRVLQGVPHVGKALTFHRHTSARFAAIGRRQGPDLVWPSAASSSGRHAAQKRHPLSWRCKALETLRPRRGCGFRAPLVLHSPSVSNHSAQNLAEPCATERRLPFGLSPENPAIDRESEHRVNCPLDCDTKMRRQRAANGERREDHRDHEGRGRSGPHGMGRVSESILPQVNIATAVPEKIAWPTGRSGQGPGICMMQIRPKEAWQRIRRDRQPLHTNYRSRARLRVFRAAHVDQRHDAN